MEIQLKNKIKSVQKISPGTAQVLHASFFSLLNTIEDGCFILDSNFTILFLNQAANEISNRTYEVIYQVGQNLLSLAPDYRKKNMSFVLQAVLQGETITFDAEFRKDPDQTIFTHCKYSPLVDERQQIIGVCVLLKDITAKKALEASENRRVLIEEKHKESLQLFEQFMENSPLRAWITAEDGAIHYMNTLHCEFLGVGTDYEGKTLFDIFPKEMAIQYAADDKTALRQGKPIEFLQVGTKPNGKKGVYKVYKFPVTIKNKKMVAGWAIELTKQIMLQKQLLNQQNKNKRAIIRSIITTQEKERRQFSVELHDNVNQIISSCKLMLEVAIENEAKRMELIQKSHHSLTEVISEIRKISHNLNPSALEDIGLVEAIYEIVERLNASGKISVEFDHLRYQLTELNSDRRITIYRILQETLNNVMKYANASHVWITLYSNDSHLLFTIRDNGVGFDVNNTKKGLGLRNILHRVAYNHGKMKIDSAPGKGCTLKVLLPIPHK